MPVLVTIPITYFEIEIDYQKPDIRVLGDRAPLIQGIFEALLAWGPKLDDVEILTNGKFSEQGVMLRLATKNVSFFVGINSCRFSRNNVDWSGAEETLAILEACVTSLEALTGIRRADMKAAIGMHLQVLEGSYKDVLGPFIAPVWQSLDAQKFTTMASIVKWEDRRVTIDGSAALANAVYLKLERDFPLGTTHEAIAQQLYKDELDVFAVMNVKDATNESGH